MTETTVTPIDMERIDVGQCVERVRDLLMLINKAEPIMYEFIPDELARSKVEIVIDLYQNALANSICAATKAVQEERETLKQMKRDRKIINIQDYLGFSLKEWDPFGGTIQ